MDDRIKVSAPVYQQIAADIAAKIVEKRYQVGDKLYARSALASQYSVSSETARRAISVLSDLKIVKAVRGSGVLITSYENAVRFVQQYMDIKSIYDLKKNILDSLERQKQEAENLTRYVTEIIDRTDRFQNINPFIPFEIEITAETPYLHRSISEINFWHYTMATIIAIRRNRSFLMSPGPYAVLCENDTLYYCGDSDCQTRVRNFLYPDSAPSHKAPTEKNLQ
jgi:K+/H+ antiporter YhaU regulatory subunit KhtT